MREDGERLLMLDEDFPDQREHTTVVDYGRIGVPVPVLLRHPEPDSAPGSAGFQPALGYTEFFAGKMPALPA